MICMIPKLNLRFGEMGFCDLQTLCWDINWMNLPGLTLVLPGDKYDSWNSNFILCLSSNVGITSSSLKQLLKRSLSLA